VHIKQKQLGVCTKSAYNTTFDILF